MLGLGAYLGSAPLTWILPSLTWVRLSTATLSLLFKSKSYTTVPTQACWLVPPYWHSALHSHLVLFTPHFSIKHRPINIFLFYGVDHHYCQIPFSKHIFCGVALVLVSHRPSLWAWLPLPQVCVCFSVLLPSHPLMPPTQLLTL